MGWYYISFATEKGFLGATAVEGNTPQDAVDNASAMGLNPGGEVAVFFVPPEAWNEADFLAMKNRLCSKAEMLAMGAIHQSELPEDLRERFEEEATFICEKHNVQHLRN